VDAPDLGSGAERCESSSLSDRTIIYKTQLFSWVLFYLEYENLLTKSPNISLSLLTFSFFL
ncbi:hypothetical protein, partial [Vibrio kanaloae]